MILRLLKPSTTTRTNSPFATTGGRVATPNYQSLIDQIAELEHERQSQDRRLRSSAHELEQQRKLAARRMIQLKVFETLSLGSVNALTDREIYALTCQTVVDQIGYASALVITISGNRGIVSASYAVESKRVESIQDHISQNQVIFEAFRRKNALSTYNDNDEEALALRALFQVEEVVAVPLRYSKTMQGYLVVCTNQHSSFPATEELEFLGALAASVSRAVEQSGNLASLQEQNVQLKELDELKNTFISITSHQLRTPLSIVKWILSILQTDKTIGEMKEQKEMINQAYETNERMIHVVNDLLNVSRIQEGKLSHNPMASDLVEVIQEQAVSYRHLLEAKKLELKLELPNQIAPMKLDQILFKEVLQNLIDNAMDYNLPEHGWIRLRVEEKPVTFSTIQGQGIHHASSEPAVVISVTNPGSGIKASEEAKIFEQFYRSPEAVQQHPNGNGLGLFLAQAIIRQHGGEIRVESKNGETTFTINLPWRNIKVS